MARQVLMMTFCFCSTNNKIALFNLYRGTMCTSNINATYHSARLYYYYLDIKYTSVMFYNKNQVNTAIISWYLSVAAGPAGCNENLVVVAPTGTSLPTEGQLITSVCGRDS